jgi:tetratricopeptide (TPR) repeat protein
MYTSLPGKSFTFLFKILPLTVIILGAVGLLVQHFFYYGSSMPIVPAMESEMVKIPLDFLDLGLYQYVLEVDNAVIFQHFESQMPVAFPRMTLAFGVLVWLLMGIGMVLISLLNRIQFVFSMGVVIFLLTLSGVNGLNIGGINTNLAMMILLSGFVLPPALIHTFYNDLNLGKRTMVILPIAVCTFPLLLWLGKVVDGALLVSEHLSVLGLAISTLFMLYIGHAVLSAVFVFLAKLNKGVGLKISWHISIISLIYLLFFLFLLLRITGNVQWDITTPPLMVLFLPVAVLGYFETKRKLTQIEQPYAFAAVGEGLYLLGFAITILVFWKAEFSMNRPMMDFLDHVFIYSQLAFGLLFYAYLMANFGSLMNHGAQVENVLFKPKFFAYYHMRIGAMLALLSIVVFADGIVGVQLNAASTNVSADYYYATGRNREAGILYEHSWERYRRNEKAMNTVAHLALAQKQPTVAVNTLVRSFENTPAVNDILLLSSLLKENGNESGAFSVLEKGLAFYPDSPFLLNNLAPYFSKNGRAEEAFQMLSGPGGNTAIATANKVALQTKHLIHYDEEFELKNNAIGQINGLAFTNLKGQLSPYTLPTDQIEEAGIKSRAILRNQWSNKIEGDIVSDLALVDTLLADIFTPSIEEELRQTRVIRTYKQNYINESLKHLNGLAYQFPNSAAKHHVMAAHILIGQLDFEKAAIELMQAEEKGFVNFKSHHIPVLYYGGLIGKAFEISHKHEVGFPEWMRFDDRASPIPNDTTVFFSALSSMPVMVKEQFLARADEMQPGKFRSFYAYQLLLRKSHWLSQNEAKRLIAWVEEDVNAEQVYEYFPELKGMLLEGEPFPNAKLSQEGLLLDRNAYWTPQVLMAVEQGGSNLEKYNLLVEASNFNKDPLLWINLVKYSRLVGVDHYTGSILNKMAEWVDAKKLEELQLDNL